MIVVYIVGIVVCWIGLFIASVFWEKDRRKTGEDYVLMPFLFLAFGWPVCIIMIVPMLVLVFAVRGFRWLASKIVDGMGRPHDEHKEDQRSA